MKMLRASVFRCAVTCFAGCLCTSELQAQPERPQALGDPKAVYRKGLIKSVEPEYPYADRAARHHGVGVFHVTVDSRTGSVVQVAVKKSTAYRALDAAAIHALKQWRWKPGTWRAFDISVGFEMAASHADYVNKVHQLQEQLRR